MTNKLTEMGKGKFIQIIKTHQHEIKLLKKQTKMIWHPISEPIPKRLWHKTILFLDNNHQDCPKDYCIHNMLGKSDGEDFYFMVDDWKIEDFTHWAEIEGPKDDS